MGKDWLIKISVAILILLIVLFAFSLLFFGGTKTLIAQKAFDKIDYSSDFVVVYRNAEQGNLEFFKNRSELGRKYKVVDEVGHSAIHIAIEKNIQS